MQRQGALRCLYPSRVAVSRAAFEQVSRAARTKQVARHCAIMDLTLAANASILNGLVTRSMPRTRYGRS